MFTITCPTAAHWLKVIASQRAELLNPRREMTILLQAVRNDVDAQFDEKQGEWQQLASYTVKKKAEANADPRILHETKVGEGLRLRDAYRQAGKVEADGKIVYSYPDEKPYAIEHQEGRTGGGDDSGDYDRGGRKLSWRLQKDLDDLDTAFEDLIRRTR